MNLTRIDDELPKADGEFSWDMGADGPVALRVQLPGGHFVRLPVHQSAGRVVWSWDGNLDAPTLTPSVRTFHRVEDRDVELWHGFITNGTFVPCPPWTT